MKIIQTTNKTALLIAILSFLLGTVFLLLFLVSKSSVLIDIGILYILVAFALNTITLISLIVNSFINTQYSKENLTTILLVLLNIPIAIGYFLIITNSISNNTPF